ncbi:MAG TPA: ABC transporter ATP-binding protein [Sporichthyaceae bacterium]|jgi:branched-chain amino acid transport system ATP-binding protein
MRFELQGITAGYGETVALRDASLVVPPGLVVALLGPNGAGKTTLLRVASGLLAPRAGRLLIDDRDVTGRSSAALTRAGLCHVTEGRSVFGSLSVQENLRMFARAGDERRARDRAVDAFPRLGERMNQIAGTLSGGEQQMLALARAYVSGASVVMLDEVSMGLAPILVDEIFAFLTRLVADGTTSLLLVEQYVTKALAIADHVYLLDRGRIVFCGEPEELDAADLAGRYLGAAG